MDSGLIGKIEKAKRYAEEKDRITINTFEAKSAEKTMTTRSLMITASGIALAITSRGAVSARTPWEWN
jgi:hypothetical protein